MGIEFDIESGLRGCLYNFTVWIKTQWSKADFQ